MRQDTKMPAEARSSPPAGSPAAAGSPVALRGLATHTASCGRSTASTSRSPAHGVLGLVGPSGCGKSTLLELVCGLREPDAGSIEVGGGADGRRAPRQLRLHAPARPALPWLSALDNAALALRNRGVAQARGAAAGGGAVRAASASRASSGRGRPSSPAGCANGSPSCARCSPTSRCSPSTSPSPRSTRSPGPRCRAGSRGPWEDPRTVAPRHPRRRGGALPLRPGRGPLRPPGAVVAELAAPAPRAADRDAAVTDPAFVAVRERALRALHGGSR